MTTRPRGKKTDIEQAAIRLFARNGAIGVTIKDIAREAGVTEGALYRHYSGKDDMAWTLFSRELARFAEGFRVCFAGSDIAAAVAGAVSHTLDYYEQNPEALAFVLLTRHGFPEELGVAAEENPVHIVAAALAEAMDKGQIGRQSPYLLGALLMGLVLHPLELLRYEALPKEDVLGGPGREKMTAACLALLCLPGAAASEHANR